MIPHPPPTSSNLCLRAVSKCASSGTLNWGHAIAAFSTSHIERLSVLRPKLKLRNKFGKLDLVDLPHKLELLVERRKIEGYRAHRSFQFHAYPD
jgi:hypothetical protein